MTTTPLMSLVLPTEGDSIDVWAPILATVFGLIDGHDHTPGKGGKVPMGGLNVNADISWSSGGISRAITDIRALDFSPQPASGMTALAGALFLNSADNNLYYRTTAGSNVQLTAGAALNIAGFAGGIGGDYSAAGALVDYDDATDTYRFRQQLGSSVRQFARMQSADLDLFEYKTSGVTPVPSFRVRLASPAALAASYALTFPGVLPASTQNVQVSSAGVMTFGEGTRTVQIPVGQSTAAGWSFGTLTNGGNFTTSPLSIPNGYRITAVRARITDSAVGPSRVTVALASRTDGAASVAIATSAQSSGAGATQTIAATGLTTTVASGTNLQVEVKAVTGAANCSVYWVEVDYDRLV